jgi:hypothetical protein
MEMLILLGVFIFVIWLVSRMTRSSPTNLSRTQEDAPVSALPPRKVDADTQVVLGKVDGDIVSIIEPLNDGVAIEKSFQSVFAIMTSQRRDAIVEFYMRKHSCGTHEAMLFAIIDRQNDEERYR